VLQVLVSKLPENNGARADADRLKKLCIKLGLDLRKAQFDSRYIPAQRLRAPDGLLISDESFGEQLIKAENEMEHDTPIFSKNVLAQAEMIREANEQKAVLASWITTGLFVLGWGLGLVGKLTGIDTTTPELGSVADE